MNLAQTMGRLDAHHRFGWSAAAALLGYLVAITRLPPSYGLVLGWNGFAVTDIALAWIVFVHGNPAEARRGAALQDSSRTFLFLLVVVACAASLAAVGFMLAPSKRLDAAMRTLSIVLVLSTVALSWVLVHTTFALRYAHHFYSPHAGASHERSGGGLQFPEGPHPDYRDFAYFSFVIGMTCQVSDVAITSRPLRRLATYHGVLSFAFNTIVLALSINLISSLL